MLLRALNNLKSVDPSLSFAVSAAKALRLGRMNINGKKMACVA